MANTPERGALIGPGTYADIKRVIERVGGMPVHGAGITKIPTDLSGNDGGFVSPTFRIATFTGTWSIGSDKNVKLVADTSRTVTATNLFWPGLAPTNAATEVQCSIAREGTAWTLINVPLETASITVVGQTGFIVAVTGTTQVNVVAATGTLQVLRDVNVIASLNESNCSIGVTVFKQVETIPVVTAVSKAAAVTGASNVRTVTATAAATIVRVKL